MSAAVTVGTWVKLAGQNKLTHSEMHKKQQKTNEKSA